MSKKTKQRTKHQNKELVLNTIKKLPKLKEPCIIHSDQGAVYQSLKIQQTLTKKGFLISMSRKANPRDNAVIENFFGQMKSILQYQHPFLFQKPTKSPQRAEALIKIISIHKQKKKDEKERAPQLRATPLFFRMNYVFKQNFLKIK
ncbi:putative transposase [Candidatus Phytoplasma solani]